MKQAKFIGKTVLSLFLVLCLSACAPSKIELSPEESHVFCEKYVEETAWIKTAASGPGYVGFSRSLERIAAGYHQYNTPLCLFEITSVEPAKPEKHSEPYWLHLFIQEVYSGDPSIKGTGMVIHVSLKSMEGDASYLIGKRYVGYLLPQENYFQPEGKEVICFSDAVWIFLVTEDNRLVSGYGCQLEDASQISEDGLSVDSRNYTGQTLDYFISKVKEAEANTQTESQENSSQ